MQKEKIRPRFVEKTLEIGFGCRVNVNVESQDAISVLNSCDQGRPKINHQPPIWLQDYKTSFACITEQRQLSSYREVCTSVDASIWGAITEEDGSFAKEQDLVVTRTSGGWKAIGYRYVYKLKKDANRNIERYKAG